MTTAYMPRAIKRHRRSKAEIATIDTAIHRMLFEEHPMTLRQLFYRLVSAGVVDKTEGEYKATVGRRLLHLRRDGAVPHSWVADSTRWMRKPRSYAGLRDVLEQTLDSYRRNIWSDQQDYVEVWLEKDALAGVLLDVTARWDVPLMVSKGYSSETYLYEAAQVIIETRKPAYLYYFGDWDPSGADISRVVEKSLRRLAPDAEIHFERVAVNLEQIAEWNLPTRPTKKTDSRSAKFAGESVEVDAIPSAQLRALVSTVIEQHIDGDVLRSTQYMEGVERDSLADMMTRLPGTWGVA